VTARIAIFPVAVLKAPRRTLQLLLYAQAVLDALTGNAYFPSPDPSLAVFAEHIAELHDAQMQARMRAGGAVALRDARQATLMRDLKHLRDYVQSMAEKADPAHAIAMITSAGLSVQVVTHRDKAELRVKQGHASGIVELIAKAVAHYAVYFWQYSVNQTDWVDVPETMKANTTITGLTRGQTYYFRFRATTKAGPVDYSQVVSLLVL
jgi:hypothetical protein